MWPRGVDMILAGAPTATVDRVPVRVMMDTTFGVTSPVKIYADTLHLEAHLRAGQRRLYGH